MKKLELIILVLLFLGKLSCDAKDIQIILKGQRSFNIQATVADNDELREKGLMLQRILPKHSGMLFVFNKQGVYRFWMKNTYLPLTIIFLDIRKRVVGIQDMEPLNEAKRYFPEKSFLYALEINQKIAKRIGLKKGDLVDF